MIKIEYFWIGMGLMATLGALLFYCICQGNELARRRHWLRCSECRRWFDRATGEYGEPDAGDMLSGQMCWCPKCQDKAADKFNRTLL